MPLYRYVFAVAIQLNLFHQLTDACSVLLITSARTITDAPEHVSHIHVVESGINRVSNVLAVAYEAGHGRNVKLYFVTSLVVR
jgi:hypothetical protein